MKRVAVIIIGFFLGISLFGQDVVPEITSIETPSFNAEKIKQLHQEPSESPICCFIKNNLVFPQNKIDYEVEGTVVVQFIVDTKGNLDYSTILNSVRPDVDEAVLNCVNSTDGMWLPGSINGQFVAMPHKVYVRFDVPYNSSHEIVARQHVLKAMELYDKAETINNKKRATRMLHKALSQLKEANRYQPEESSVAYWKIRIYDKLGDDNNKMLVLDDFFSMCIKSDEIPVNMAGGQ